MKNLIYVFILLLIGVMASAQTTGTFTDPRDGEVYKTITIEDPLTGTIVTWFAENLRYQTPKSWTYENNPKYLKALGRLYHYDALANACPRGWRVPTNADWNALINEFGGEKNAGEALKSTKGWNDLNGNNSSGFNALPAGLANSNGNFIHIGETCHFWSSSKASEYGKVVWVQLAAYTHSIRIRDYASAYEFGFCIRCVRD